jgi:hypothetical protein
MKTCFLTLAPLVVACGDDVPAIVDAEPPLDVDTGGCFAIFDACNPVAQTGCEAGRKCTWQHHTKDDGRVACVPEGSVAIGGACVFLPPGETGGYDDCVRGTYCRGVCKEICVDAPDSCPLGTECTVYPGIFTCSAGSGVCEPR